MRRAASSAAAGVSAAVGVTAESKGLRGEVARAAAAASAGQNVKVGVSVDDRKLRSLLASVTGGVAGAGGALAGLTIPPAFLQGIAAATAGLVSMGGAAVAVIAPLSQLAGLIPALAVGGVAVAAGFGVVAGAMSGVGDALKAYTAEQKEAATATVGSGQSAQAAARAHEAAAEAVADATDRLAAARENQARDAERSAESIADAQGAVEDAQQAQVETAERSAERVAAAQNRVVEAHGNVVDAERDLTELRSELADRAAEAQERYQERLESSNDAILRAEEELADQRIALAEDVADAQARLEENRLEGIDRVRAAERRIADVQRRSADEDRERRQRNTDRAALDAAKTPEARRRVQAQIDARKDREDQANDRERTVRDLKDAQDDLARLKRDAAKQEERDREALATAQENQAKGIEEAENNVTAARKEGLKVQREGQALARQQIEAERRIARAVEDVQEARKAEAEAQRDVGRAQLEASRDAVRAQDAVSDAVTALARTQRDADRSAADAQKSILAASRDLERAMRRAGEVAEETGTTGAAAVDKFAVAMDGLSPAAQSFVRSLIGVKDTLKVLRDAAAEGLFPGFEAGLRNVNPLLVSLAPSVSLVAGTIGELASELGALLGGPESLAGFAALGASSAEILDRLGRAALILIPPLGQLLVHAIPLATTLADMAVSGAKVFAAFVDGKAKTGELAQMFRNTESTLRTLGSIANNIGGALRGVFSAALPTGLEYLGLLDRASEKFRNLVRSDAGQSGLRKFFEESKPLVLELSGLIGDVVRGLGGIGANLAPQLTPVIAQIRSELVPALLSLVDSIDGDFLATLVTLTSQVARFAEAFFQPTETLKAMLEVIGGIADVATFALTELGPLSVVIGNVASAFTLLGTALAGAAIARKLSEIVGMRKGIDGTAAALGTKGGSAGLSGALSGLVFPIAAAVTFNSIMKDLAPSVDRTTAKLLKLPATVEAFDAEVRKLNKPGFFDTVFSQLSKPVLAQFGLITTGSKEASAAAQANFTKVFRELAEASPDFAFKLVESMRAAGRPTKEFEDILRSLGLAQRFMATETDKATAAIKAQDAAARGNRLAELDLLDAIERLGTGLAENKAGFDENTTAGRQNLRAREDVLDAVERNIEALIKDAEHNGIDAGKVEELRGRLQALKDKYPELATQIDQFAGDFNGSLDKIKDKEVTLYIRPGGPNDTGQVHGPSVSEVAGGFEKGGYVTRNLPKRGPTDTIPAWLAQGEYVATAAEVRGAGGPSAIAAAISAAAHKGAPGFAAGGYVDFNLDLPQIGAMVDGAQAWFDGRAQDMAHEAQSVYDARPRPAGAPSSTPSSGSVGGGSVGSGWEEITAYLDSVGQDYTVTSTVRPGAITSSGNLSNHALGKAVDMVGDMSTIFDVLLNIGSSLSELFYDPKGFSIKNGERVDWTVGGHDDHVHAATFDRGGVLEPGWNRVRNATGGREELVPVGAPSRGDERPMVVEVTSIMDGKVIGTGTATYSAEELRRQRRARRRW